MLRKAIWSALVILVPWLLAVPAGAAVLDQLKDDFRTASGFIIMAAGDEYLIDQDATTGTRTGDLFTVVEKGEKIIHPVTQEVLGTLDEVKGLLQVTRVKTGYSYVRPVGKAETLERGEVVRRFDHVPTTFWDYTGQGAGFSSELKAALPALDWQSYDEAQAGRPPVPSPEAAADFPLVFVLRRDGLTVHGPDFVVQKSYPPPVSLTMADTQAAPPVSSPAVSPPAPTPVVPVPAPIGMKAQTPATPQPVSPAAGSVVYPGFDTIGAVPETALMADFVQTSEGLLLATTDGRTIRVFRLTAAGLASVAAGKPENPVGIKTVSWWQPAADGPLHVVATVAVDANEPYSPAQSKTVNGLMFVLNGPTLEQVRDNLPYILGTFDMDEDGRPETLLGQPFDRNTFFGYPVKKLELVDGELKKSSFDLELPVQFPVSGSLLADVTGDGRKEAVFVRSQVLFVYQGRKKLYESSKKMGGSVSSLTYNIFAGSESELLTTVPFEVPPLFVDLDGDDQREIVAIGSVGSSFGASGIGPGVDAAGLVAIKYEKGLFHKGTIGDMQESPIQGLAADGSGFYLVVTKSPDMLGVAGNSRLLRLSLSRP